MKNNKLSILIALIVGLYIGLCKLGTPTAEAIGVSPPIALNEFSKPKPFNLDIDLDKNKISAQDCSPSINVTITTATKYYPYVVYKNKKQNVANVNKWIEVDKNIINSLNLIPNISQSCDTSYDIPFRQ